MGGCSSKNDSKAAVPATAAKGDGNQTLLAGGTPGDRKQAVDDMVAAVRQAQEPHHVDTTITMCPVFKIEPKNLQLWKAQCDTFYEAAKKEDGMLSYGFAYSEAEGSGKVHIRQCYRDSASLLAHLRAVDVPMQAALKLSQLERVEVHGLASELAKVRQELTKLGDACVQFFETEPTAMRRPTACSGEHGSDTAVTVSHRYKVDASGVALVTSHAGALAAHAASAPGVDHHALSTSETGSVQLQHGYADAEAAIKHLQASQEHRASCLEQHATLEGVEIHGPPSEIEKLKALMAGACAKAGEAAAGAAGAVEGAAQEVGDAAVEGAGKAKESAEAAAASLQHAALYILDGHAIRRAFSSTVAKVEGVLSGAEHAVAAEAHAAGAAASQAAHAAEAKAAAGAAAVGHAAGSAAHTIAEDMRAAAHAASSAAHSTEAKAAATAAVTAAAIGSAVASAEHTAAEDARAAGAAASGAAHAAEDKAAAAAVAVGSAVASAEHTAAEDVRAAEAAASSAAHAAEAKAAAAAVAVGSAVASAEHTAAEDVRAAEAAASSAAHATEAKAAAAAVAVGSAAASAGHVVAEDVRGAEAAVSNAAASAKKAAAADVRAAKVGMANAVDSAEGDMVNAENAAADGVHAAEAKAAAAAAAVGGAAVSAEHAAAEDIRAAGAAAGKAATEAESKIAGTGAAGVALAGAAAAAVGAGVVSAVAAAKEAVHPHHIDTTVTMCPYFKIQASNLQIWKAQCDTFYEAAKKEDGLLFYGFCFEETEGDCEVHVRQGFKDAASLLAHLRAIDVPIQAAIKLSQLERVEVHGPAAELKKVEAEQTDLGDAKFQFFETEPEPLRRTSPHAGDHGSDQVVSLCHYYDAAGTAEAKPQMQASASKLRGEALNTPGLEHHGFAVDAASGRAHLGQGFLGADEAIASLARDAAVHRELAQTSGQTVRLEVHGPAAELAKIRVFIVEQEADASADQGATHAAEQLRGARLFTLDGRALRRAYAGSPPADTDVTIALEVELQPAVMPQQRSSGWGFFAMCGGC